MKPLKLAIYHGYPSSINKLIDYNNIIDEYAKYDIVIFGGHHNDPNLKDIIEDLSSKYTFSFGYIDMKWHKDEIKDKVYEWENIGVYGIFLDHCGYDCSISRSKQNNILDFVHDLNFIAFVRSTNPNDIIEDHLNIWYNPFGINSSIKGGDWYLYEGFQINNGKYENPVDWQEKSNKLLKLNNKFGINIACVATNGPTSEITQSDADYSYLSSVIYGFDAWGYAEYMYSRDSDYLPYVNRKKIYGTQFISKPVVTRGIIKRNTNIGITIDTNKNKSSILLK